MYSYPCVCMCVCATELGASTRHVHVQSIKAICVQFHHIFVIACTLSAGFESYIKQFSTYIDIHTSEFLSPFPASINISSISYHVVLLAIVSYLIEQVGKK